MTFSCPLSFIQFMSIPLSYTVVWENSNGTEIVSNNTALMPDVSFDRLTLGLTILNVTEEDRYTCKITGFKGQLFHNPYESHPVNIFLLGKLELNTLCVLTCVYVYVCVCVCACVCLCMYICVCACVRACVHACRMWDMSALIRRCENFGLFYSFCSQLVVDAESQTRDQDVGRHVDVRTITFLEGLLLLRRSY